MTDGLLTTAWRSWNILKNILFFYFKVTVVTSCCVNQFVLFFLSYTIREQTASFTSTYVYAIL